MRLKVEMTLTGKTAQRLKVAGERIAVMNLGEDGMLAAGILMRIAADDELAAAKKAVGSDADYSADMQAAAEKLQRAAENEDNPEGLTAQVPK